MNQNNTTPYVTSESEECLSKANFMGSKLQLEKIQGFWYNTAEISNFLKFQTQFLAQDTDLLVASFPKTGTTWLKSLLYSVVNRSLNPLDKSPMLTHNPHELVYDLESSVYGSTMILHPYQLNELPSPRLLSSHVPYTSLPESIKASGGKILYICRNPFVTFVSQWHFFPKIMERMIVDEDFKPPNIEDFFEEFCQGKIFFGPFFEHVVGYWKQSLEQPNKILFLRYEDLKENLVFYVKKLAEFIGMPFSSQEENEGVIQQIIKLCSIKHLKELEVNKSGFVSQVVENKTLFRAGEVGGWTRYFTPLMVERMNELMEQKLGGTDLSFKLHAA